MRLILVCVLACLAGATTALADTAIEYSVTPLMTGSTLTALAVTVRLDGEDDGDTVLNLPNDWGGKTKLYESIRDLRIAGGDVIAQPDPAKRLVHHRPKAKLFRRV